MTDRLIVLKAAGGRKRDFAIERLRTGMFFDPGTYTWHRPRGREPYARMREPTAGHYEADLPVLDLEHDYCLHVVDVDTRQLVASQVIDVRAHKTQSSRTLAMKGPAPTTDPYFAGAAHPGGKGRLQHGAIIYDISFLMKGRPHHIAIIYDTSFLMNGCCVDLSLHLPKDIPKEELDRTVTFTQVVPGEVKEEIHRHFRDPAKEGKAKRARAIVASLMSDDGNGFQLQEVELKPITRPHASGEILGADSLVDRLILGYAVELLVDRGFFAVFIATADGGIKLDIAKLRKQEGRKLFVIEDFKPSPDLKTVLWQATQGVRILRKEIAAQAAAEACRRKSQQESIQIGAIMAALLLLAIFLIKYFG